MAQDERGKKKRSERARYDARDEKYDARDESHKFLDRSKRVERSQNAF
jgi:hypothetical protein